MADVPQAWNRAIPSLQDLQAEIGVTADGTEDGSCFDPFESAAVGDGHTHDILDDVAAAQDFQLFGHLSQHLTGFGRCISNGILADLVKNAGCGCNRTIIND